MVRALGLVVVIAAIPVGAYVFVHQHQLSNAPVGPVTPAIVQDESQANSAVAATNFQSAAVAMQAFLAANGTYAGASLPAGDGVTVMRADVAAYCLQAGTGDTAQRLVGPNGQPEPGSC